MKVPIIYLHGEVVGLTTALLLYVLQPVMSGEGDESHVCLYRILCDFKNLQNLLCQRRQRKEPKKCIHSAVWERMISALFETLSLASLRKP